MSEHNISTATALVICHSTPEVSEDRHASTSILRRAFRRAAGELRHRLLFVYGSLLPSVYNWISRLRYAHKVDRRLEIGPRLRERLHGFETLNIVPGARVDYVADATGRLPLYDNTFDLVYASHVLEHVPWYKVEDTLKDWVRVLKHGGCLEIWVPDGLKICQTVVAAEEGASSDVPDEWVVRNPARSPYVWAAGRMFWGGNPNYPSWHHAFFTPQYLKELLERTALSSIQELESEENRGYDHGWINLGVRGTKP